MNGGGGPNKDQQSTVVVAQDEDEYEVQFSRLTDYYSISYLRYMCLKFSPCILCYVRAHYLSLIIIYRTRVTITINWNGNTPEQGISAFTAINMTCFIESRTEIQQILFSTNILCMALSYSI